MNKIKTGVFLYGIQPEMVMCDNIIQTIFRLHGHHCIRTSVVDGEHGAFSLHPPGFGIDYRTKIINMLLRKEAINNLIVAIKEALPCCDVVLEDFGGDNEHLHVEFDPKDDDKFIAAKQIYRATGVWPARW